DEDDLRADSHLGVVYHAVVAIPAVFRQWERRSGVRLFVGAGAVVVEQEGRARSALAEGHDGEIEDIAVRALARSAQADEPLAVGREAWRYFRPRPAGQLPQRAGL